MLVLVEISKLETVGSCLLEVSFQWRLDHLRSLHRHITRHGRRGRWVVGKETHSAKMGKNVRDLGHLSVLCLSFFIP